MSPLSCKSQQTLAIPVFPAWQQTSAFPLGVLCSAAGVWGLTPYDKELTLGSAITIV